MQHLRKEATCEAPHDNFALYLFQGQSAAMHSSADPVAAVLAADFTLGYFYKLLLDLEPACGGHGVLGELWLIVLAAMSKQLQVVLTVKENLTS